MPERVQMSRQRPWRKDHPDAVIVARPSKWGNPFSIEEFGVREAIRKYELYVAGMVREGRLDISALSGKDLACWCPINPGWVDADGEPIHRCHADVILELANPVGGEGK